MNGQDVKEERAKKPGADVNPAAQPLSAPPQPAARRSRRPREEVVRSANPEPSFTARPLAKTLWNQLGSVEKEEEFAKRVKEEKKKRSGQRDRGEDGAAKSTATWRAPSKLMMMTSRGRGLCGGGTRLLSLLLFLLRCAYCASYSSMTSSSSPS